MWTRKGGRSGRLREFLLSIRVHFLLLLLVISLPSLIIGLAVHTTLGSSTQHFSTISRELQDEIRPVVLAQLELRELDSQLPVWLVDPSVEQRARIEQLIGQSDLAMALLQPALFEDEHERNYLLMASATWQRARSGIEPMLAGELPAHEHNSIVKEGMRRIDATVEQLDHIHEDALAEVDEAYQEATALSEHLDQLVQIVLPLGVVAILAALYLVDRLYFCPLEEVRTACTHYSRGALDYRLKPHYSTEFKTLIQTVNGMAVRLDEQQQKLQEAAIRDGLTGLYNHAEFGNQLNAQWADAVRRERNLVVIMMDLDLFKQVNDTYGHPTGDRVLCWVAETLRTLVRPSDTIARYGGEEFALLLPETDLEGAVAIAERILSGFREARFALADGGEIRVTVSIGAAQGPIGLSAADRLLSNADEALYRAKNGGRDRLVVFQRVEQ